LSDLPHLFLLTRTSNKKGEVQQLQLLLQLLHSSLITYFIISIPVAIITVIIIIIITIVVVTVVIVTTTTTFSCASD
jgi:hypothetical protein